MKIGRSSRRDLLHQFRNHFVLEIVDCQHSLAQIVCLTDDVLVLQEPVGVVVEAKEM